MAVTQEIANREAFRRFTDDVNKATSSAMEQRNQPGVKLDDGKPDVLRWVIAYFPNALREVARVSEAGAEKYCEGGWRTVPDGIRRYAGAMVRHYIEIIVGQKYDDDVHPAFYNKKILHRAQVAWNALAALELELTRNP